MPTQLHVRIMTFWAIFNTGISGKRFNNEFTEEIMQLLVRNRVADFAKWKRVFDDNKTAGDAAGLSLLNMWRAEDDPNNVFFLFEVESKQRTLEFMNSPESREAGRVSGVIDGEFYFLNPI